MVEGGDEALAPVPVMKYRRDNAARLEPPVKPDAVEHLERRRMVGAGARHLVEEIAVAQLLDQRDRDPRLRQREREAEADRPGADDDDAIARRQAQTFGTTSFTAPTQPVWVRSNRMPSGPSYLHS